ADVLMQKPGVYADEVARATWWRFWLIVGAAAVATAVLSIFSALFLQIRFSSSLFSIIAVLLTPVFTLIIAPLTVFVGSYASHRWALQQGGGGSLVKHAYTVALAAAPVMVLNAALGFVFNLLGIGVGLLTLVFSIYSLYIIGLGFERLHAFRDPNQKWITAAIYVVAVIVTSFIVGLLLSPLLVAGALPFAF